MRRRGITSKIGLTRGKMTPIIGDLIKNTVGKVVGKLADHYLPASMTEAEKAQFRLDAQNIAIKELEANKDIIAAVNKTMQAEAQSDKWWTSGWRPYWGFISGTAFLFVCVIVCWLLWVAVVGGKPEIMALLPQVITAFTALFAIPGAILGVTAYHRGKMQRIEAGEITSPDFVASLKKLTGKGK